MEAIENLNSKKNVNTHKNGVTESSNDGRAGHRSKLAVLIM